MNTVLENSIVTILVILISGGLSLFIGINNIFIIIEILFLIMATLILKNVSFYEKLLNITNKQAYIKYIGSDSASKMIQRNRYAIKYYFWSIIILLCIFIAHSSPIKDNLRFLKFLIILSIMLINSIVGMYLHKKFENNIQYTISSIIFFVLILCIVFLI